MVSFFIYHCPSSRTKNNLSFVSDNLMSTMTTSATDFIITYYFEYLCTTVSVFGAGTDIILIIGHLWNGSLCAVSPVNKRMQQSNHF